MRSRRQRAEPRLIRPIPALLALVAGLGLSAALALASSTEVGQTTLTPTFPVNTPVVQSSTVAGTASYETPDGVLTRWRFHSRNEPSPGSIKLKVFRRTGAPAGYRVIGESEVKTLAPDTAYEFTARISVQQGDLLGLLAQGDADVGIDVPGATADKIGQFGGGDIPAGSTGTTTTDFPNLRVNVAATVESDADKDGFGDDSQDACPTDATRQDACPAKPTPPDKAAPVQTLTAKRSQDVDKLAVFVKSNEAGTVTAKASVTVPGASRRLTFRPVTRTLRPNVKRKLRLKLKAAGLRRVRRALRRGRKPRARVTITAKDAAANASVKKLRIRLRD